METPKNMARSRTAASDLELEPEEEFGSMSWIRFKGRELTDTQNLKSQDEEEKEGLSERDLKLRLETECDEYLKKVA